MLMNIFSFLFDVFEGPGNPSAPRAASTENRAKGETQNASKVRVFFWAPIAAVYDR
jgi:hypothetical protein